MDSKIRVRAGDDGFMDKNAVGWSSQVVEPDPGLIDVPLALVDVAFISSAEEKNVLIEEETTCCLAKLKPWSSRTAVMSSARWIMPLVVAREREPVMFIGEARQSLVGLTMPPVDGVACNSVGVWGRASVWGRLPAPSSPMLLVERGRVGVS